MGLFPALQRSLSDCAPAACSHGEPFPQPSSPSLALQAFDWGAPAAVNHPLEALRVFEVDVRAFTTGSDAEKVGWAPPGWSWDQEGGVIWHCKPWGNV